MEVQSWLARAAAAHPGRAALEPPSGSLSYAQLDAATTSAAGSLAAAGARPGERVALALAPGHEFAVALHACWRLGAVAVPVDLRLGTRERAAVTAGATVIVDRPLGADRQAGVALGATHDLDAVAVVIHTSGSSGPAKPVELTYGNLLWSALGSAVALGLDARERWLCALPLAHVGGLSIVARSAIYATTAIVHERFDAAAVLAELTREHGATLVSLVPTTLARLLDAGLRRPPALRCALVGGAALTPELARRARAAEIPVSHTYGLSEACSQVTTQPVADLGGGDAGPPLFCTRVTIAADDEILVAGPTVAPAALTPDGRLHTGDLGALDAGGRLRVAGRKAELIVSGGENVAPAEVEAALLEHPAVADAGVFGAPDGEWGEAVSATIVLAPGATAAADELRAHCNARLAGYKVPKRFAFAARLPRTASGKLLRRELR